MKRAWLLCMASAAMLAATLSLCASPGARAEGADPAARRKVTLRSTVPSFSFGVPLLAVANDDGKAHGLDIDYQTGGTASSIAIDTVLSGQTDFGAAGTPNILQAIREGARIRIVAAIVSNTHLVVLRNDVIARLGVSPTAPVADRVRALKGLTIVTSAVGSTHYQMARAYLRQYGLDPDRDVRMIGVADPTAMLSGLEQKRYDAIAYASPVVERTVATNAASIWISGPRGDIAGSDGIRIALVFASTDTVENRRADVDAFRASLADALRAIHDDPAGAGDRLRARYFPSLDRGIWDLAWTATVSSYPADLSFTRDAYEYWTANDPKGANSFRDTDYEKIVYDPAKRP